MKIKKFLLPFILPFLLILETACSIGLGPEVDLEAPEITITSPKNLSLVRKKITLTGTCTDNLGVTEVIVSNRTTNESYGNADISGTTWTKELTLEEGEVDLVCTVKDAANNSSVKSSKTIMLLVDETAPEGLSWYVDRGDGVQVALMEEAELKDVDTTLAKNKQIPQNEKFTVYGRFYDAMSIDTISLILSEGNTEILRKTITAQECQSAGEGKSIYAPSFEFTHNELVTAKSSLNKGRHYLKVSYYSADDNKNKGTRELSYILWYPESDYPGIQQAAATNNTDGVTYDSTLSIGAGSSIPLHFFDDDELSEVAYDFIPDTDFSSNGFKLSNVEEKKSLLTNKKTSAELSGRGDLPLQISAGTSTGVFYLVAYAEDNHGKKTVKIIKTMVSDASMPLLIIESPNENSVPGIKSGTNEFEIKGYSYDTSGSKDIKIAYIPGKGTYDTATKRETRAKELFGGAEPANGEILKTVTFNVNKTKGQNDRWYTEPFTFTFDVLNDFGSEKNENKFFEFVLEDTDGNKVYKQFNISPDKTAPEIEINKPEEDMIVCDYSHDNLVLKFNASKTTGLGLDTSKFKIERKDYEDTLNWTLANGGLTLAADGYYTATINKSDLLNWAEGKGGYSVDVQPVFTFYAEDVLGNKTSDKRTVVLSPLPVLKSITVDKISGKYPEGTKLTFQAKFSDSVKVTGTPRLKLKGLSSEANPYAYYTTGTGTDTLTFEYTVGTDVYTEENVFISCDGTGIDLNKGTIKTGTQGTGNATITFISKQNFWDTEDNSPNTIKRRIEVDAIAPYIQTVSATIDGVAKDKDGNYYVNENREIVMALTFSENVNVSGNPALKVNGIPFTFQSLDGKEVKFSYRVGTGKNESDLKINLSSCFTDNDRKLICDTAGNPMKKGTTTVDPKIVIDTKKPETPVPSGIEAKNYNTYPELTITTDDTNNKVEYSLNGGLSWNTYTTKVTISETGSHILTVRATDKAGNVSPISDNIEFFINDTFPEIDEISIAKTDGKYKNGTEVEFKVFLHDVVEPFSATTGGNPTAYIKFKDTDKKVERQVNVTAETKQTNKLIFKYTVQAIDDIKGVTITEVNLGSIRDKYSNTAGDKTDTRISALLNKDGTTNRPNLILDGEVPHVVKYKLGSTDTDHNYTSGGASSISRCSNNAFTITLYFNENIIKESGEVILQRKGNWAIPPVLDSTEFTDLYNKMTTANRELMMKTEGRNGAGVELTSTTTGMPVGPYQKITHGLKDDGNGNAVPDVSTKYVLAFDYGLYDDISTTDKTVSNIRKALKSVNYDKHTLQVNTSNVEISGSAAGKTDILTISFADTIEDGQEWELLLPSDAFHDETGNYFGGFKSVDDTATNKQTFSLWSNKVAQPVVRVNRYSHGMGAYGLNASGVKTLITGWTEPNGTDYAENSGSNLIPLGYAEVRVDCETKDAVIHYQTINGGTAVASDYAFTNNGSNEDDSHKSNIADKTIASLELTSGGTEYSGLINVGDTTNNTNRYQTARKDYVTAYATKTNFTTSEPGYEGVYKTIIILYKSNSANQINIEGGTAKGGEPNVSGFPLRDATDDHRYAKNAYYYTDNDVNYFAWVSYEIVNTNFAVLQHRSNYSSNYPTHSYGQLLYLYNYSTWE